MYSGFITTVSGKITHHIAYEDTQLLPIGGMVSWGHLYQSAYNTAFTVLLHALGDRKKVQRLAHRFKREIVSELYYDCSWSMTQEEVIAWAKNSKISFIPRSYDKIVVM